MSDPTQQCPSVWQEITTPHRVCGRRSTTGSCKGLTYSNGSEQYDQVCGRIIGYQLGNTDSFLGSSWSIDTMLMALVWHTAPPPPRQHIWTFSNGLDELSTTYPYATCPCVTGSTIGNRICWAELFLWNRHNPVVLEWQFYAHFLSKWWPPVGWTGPGVVPLAPVIPSTHHHGSMYDCLPPQPIILRSGSVIEAQLNKINKVILWYNSSNFMWNELHMTYMLIHQYISLKFM